jgi:protein gp37
MAENSKIEWTEHTFNPWVGCTKISPGCDHCYAESWAKRAGSPGLWNGARRRTTPQNWRQPLKWNAAAAAAGVRARVFCASLADVFDNLVSSHWRWDLFALIRETPNLDWLLLTKRIGNAREMLNSAASSALDSIPGTPSWELAPWPNVWIGATVVNQEEAERDIPKLLNVPASLRFLSCEPLLGALDLEYPESLFPNGPQRCCSGHECGCMGQPVDPPLIHGVNWVIVGGESGGKARPFDLGAARSIVRQCAASNVHVFVKQLGSRPEMNPGPVSWPTTDPKGGDMTEWPEDLRVREFPR